MKLSDRIYNMVLMCPYSDIIVDIGCDHGYASIELINQNKCKKVYATDINKLPLEKALMNIKSNNLSDKIECILTDGLKFLTNGTNKGAIIAGMGGRTISNIIDDSYNIVKQMDYLLLQPTAYSKDIRNYIYNKNICIEKEDIVFSEGVYYEYILIFPKRQEVLSKQNQKFLHMFDYELPVIILENEYGKYNDYILHKIKKYKEIVVSLEKFRNIHKEKFLEILNKIEFLKGCIKK